jgi:NAD(P)-dependent dehydrogenase (short-subunit alcohol dehydrogenase family)
VGDCRGAAKSGASIVVLARIECESVNNAAIFGSLKPFIEADSAWWCNATRVDVFGPVQCARAVSPSMIAWKRGLMLDIAPCVRALPIWLGYFNDE